MHSAPAPHRVDWILNRDDSGNHCYPLRFRTFQSSPSLWRQAPFRESRSSPPNAALQFRLPLPFPSFRLPAERALVTRVVDITTKAGVKPGGPLAWKNRTARGRVVFASPFEGLNVRQRWKIREECRDDDASSQLWRGFSAYGFTAPFFSL
jgi:hypothetical protein